MSHGARAIEIAADSLAHGLLSSPVEFGQKRDREFARFAVLTGIPSPRLEMAVHCDDMVAASSVTASRSKSAKAADSETAPGSAQRTPDL